jgi:hypothetical protein
LLTLDTTHQSSQSCLPPQRQKVSSTDVPLHGATSAPRLQPAAAEEANHPQHWCFAAQFCSAFIANWRTVLWAQRSNKTDAAKNFIYLTISVPDVQPSNLKLDLKPQSLTFSGHSDSLKRDYHLELEFYAEIDKEESKINHTAKNIEIVLRKKELKEEFWPRLLKDAKKVHFLKTDFDKWVDEDEQDEAPEDDLGT